VKLPDAEDQHALSCDLQQKYQKGCSRATRQNTESILLIQRNLKLQDSFYFHELKIMLRGYMSDFRLFVRKLVKGDLRSSSHNEFV
jgi:hypothetical protein